MFSGPPKTVPIPLLWKDLQVCILTNRCRGCAEVMLSLFLAEVMLHAEADQNDSGGETDSGHDFLTHQTEICWQNNCISLDGDAFCFVGAYFLLFGFPFHSIWRVRLHVCRLTPRAHCVLPLWEGIYTCFWDRCRVRGREGTAFPCIPFSDCEALDFSSSGSLLGRPTETMVKAVRRMRSLSEFHRDMDVSCHRWHPSRCPVEGPKCAVCRRHRPENCFSKAVDKLIPAVVPFLCCALYANLTESLKL